MLKPLSSAPDRALRGTALLRIDVNAADDWRLMAVLPTIDYLAERARKVVVISHKGRPVPGKRLGNLSLRSDADTLAQLTDREVWFVDDTTVPGVRESLKRVPDGAIAVLENIRAFKGEATDSAAFAASLSTLGDYYVSDAFPVLHHPAASVTGLPALMPSYAGFQLVEEVNRLSSLTERVKHPYVVVIGGAKAVDKLGVLESVIGKADAVLVGGASGNALLALRGTKVGSSVYERDPKLLSALEPYVNHPKVIVPVDFVRSGGKILDIGPRTRRLFADRIRKARTILWTGPLGLIEKKRFEKGSLAVAQAIAKNRKALSVTGGGETVTFLKERRLDRGFSFISTGGGAMIDFVAGKDLPGLSALSGRRAKAAPRKAAAKKAVKLPKEPKPRKVAPVYDIFFHDDLDGRATAAVFLDFLRSRGSRIQRFIPVEHGVKEIWEQKDALDRLAGTRRRNPAIVVDFPYHPQAAFWYDHHPHGKEYPELAKSFQPGPAHRVDASYLSACRLAIDALEEGYGYRPPAHIRTLGKWLDVVDGGRFANPFQTIAIREPALQLEALVNDMRRVSRKAGKESDPMVWLIELMASKDVAAVARDRRVKEVVRRVQGESKASLAYYRHNMRARENVALIDITDMATRSLNFAPYYLAPSVLFAITMRGNPDGTWIASVGVNPWKRERNPFHIGNLLTPFNGGGHAYAGAAQLMSRAELDRFVDHFVSLFNGGIR